MHTRYRNLLAAAFLVGVLLLVWRLQGSETTTMVLLLTAAEVDGGDSASLSSAGRARSESLSRLVGNLAQASQLAPILSAGGEPERETVRLLAERLQKPISDVLIEDPAAFARGLARRYRGKVVIVVASATLAAALWAELDGTALNPTEFGPGRLHLVSVPSFGQPRTLLLNY